MKRLKVIMVFAMLAGSSLAQEMTGGHEQSSSEQPLRIGNGVSAPVLVSMADPQYTKKARAKKVSGSILVHLVVAEDGLPTDVKVVRGIGYGLDEKAVEAVKQYRFKPATKDGQPVKVALNVEVNFRIF